jgi:hypothetical protein
VVDKRIRVKYFKIILPFFIATSLVFISCSKNKTETQGPPGHPVDYSNVNLRVQPLDTIKKAVRGRWKIHYSMILGWADWTIHIDTSHFISFLANDTLKREFNGAVTIYEKSIIKRQVSVMSADAVYAWTYNNGQYSMIPDQIFSDTLKIAWGSYFLYGTKNP